MREHPSYPVSEDDVSKACDALDGSYHYRFDKRNGNFVRWGRTLEEDPEWCPPGPELLDLEISVNGCPGRCPFCYKGNTESKADNMSLETFVSIFHRMPKTLTQIAFGITGLETNPDFFGMMEYSRGHGVIPNFTTSGHGMTDEIAGRISMLAGSVAVSVTPSNKEIAFDAVNVLSAKGLQQVNIHLVASLETLPFIREVLSEARDDNRLRGLNAIVLLAVKPKGRAKGLFNPLPDKSFREVVVACLASGKKLGFDSCSAPKFKGMLELCDPRTRRAMEMMSESCESGLFSSYVNVKGEFYPCSFCEGEEGWRTGISVLEHESFLEVWKHHRLSKWRKTLLETSVCGCRSCPVFDLSSHCRG